MEGKKIAFIVVAIATIGVIAYYLNKRNKQLVGGLTSAPETKNDTANSTFSKKPTAKEISKVKDTVKAFYAGHEVATPTYTLSSYNDEYRGGSNPSQRVATGYKN